MLNNTIEIFDLPVPKKINEETINYLGTQAAWKFVFEKDREFCPKFNEIITPDKITDSGMGIISYSRNNMKGTTVDYSLNSIGNWIFYLCQEKSSFKIKHLDRLYWNLYSPSAVCAWHTDTSSIGEYASVVYNLHTNDGGTEFESGKVIAKESQAIIFPSDLKHRGLAPKKNKWRLSLNMLVKI